VVANQNSLRRIDNDLNFDGLRSLAKLRSFAFTALHPTFAGNPFTLCGKPSDDGQEVELWARDHNGYLTMRAAATLA
jgi:hydroxyacyl-ACP dehydratase HTD2-like protein with hotdog domain